MSKEKPEVGDVFEFKTKNDHYKFYVIDVDGYDCEVVVTAQNKIWTSYTLISGDFKYLGKSKANINDLFETENEE